jgi:hypothetical protein
MIDKDTVERQLYGHVDVAKRDLPDGFSVGPLDAVGGSDGALLGPDNNERVVEKGKSRLNPPPSPTAMIETIPFATMY